MHWRLKYRPENFLSVEYNYSLISMQVAQVFAHLKSFCVDEGTYLWEIYKTKIKCQKTFIDSIQCSFQEKAPLGVLWFGLFHSIQTLGKYINAS